MTSEAGTTGHICVAIGKPGFSPGTACANGTAMPAARRLDDEGGGLLRQYLPLCA